MMQPAKGIALQLLFIRVGAAIALIIPDRGNEFSGRILGQIMEKALFIEAARKTVPADQCPVLMNGFQMSAQFAKKRNPGFGVGIAHTKYYRRILSSTSRSPSKLIRKQGFI